MSILGVGMKSYQRHCGHTVFHVTEQQKLHLITRLETVELQNDLTVKEYVALMNNNIEDLTELRLWSLEKIKENKAKVARVYNKKVKLKEFQVEDLVWEAVLPLGTKDAAYGKWSLNWHGPLLSP
jgi:hypothetical protein